MSRSSWKGPFLDKYFLKKKTKNKFKHVIWSRRSTITAPFIGKQILVHTGKEFKKIFVTRKVLGFKFGQFLFTKKNAKNYKTINKKSPKKTTKK